MKVFITGGSGFIGINVMKRFLEAGDEVFNYDRYPIPPAAERMAAGLPGRYRFIQGDVLDRESLFEALSCSGAELAMHMAVITAIEEQERSSAKAIFDVNCGGTLNMLDGAVKEKAKRFLYISSVAVYGDLAFQADCLTEDMDRLSPKNLYQITKYTSERLALRYKELYGLELACVRLGDVFGPWERPTRFREKMSAPCAVLQYALNHQKAVLKREGRTGWVYSGDIANGIFALSRGELSDEVYNLSSPFIWSVKEWCQGLKEYFPDFQWEMADKPEEANVFCHGNKDNAPMSIERLKGAGYEPVFDREKAMEDYVRWCRRYPELMRSR